MANKLYEESHIQNIANAIRGKTGKSDLLDVSEMAGEISNISAGLDTSDATVTASDLAEGVVAYGSNGRIVGSVKTVDSGWIRDENENTTVSSGSITNDGVTTKLIKSKYKFTSNNLFRSGSFVEVGVNVNEFGNATAADVLEGRTFTSADGLKVVGTGTLKMFTWEKYSVIDGTTSAAYSQQEIANKYGTKLSSTTITLYSSMSFNANTGVFTLSGSNINNWGNVYSNKTYQTHPYYFVDDAHTKVAKISSMTPPRTGSIVQNYGVNYTEYYSLANEQGFAKGEYIEDVTSTYSHEYPADGYQDGYWYVLKSEGGSGGNTETCTVTINMQKGDSSATCYFSSSMVSVIYINADNLLVQDNNITLVGSGMTKSGFTITVICKCGTPLTFLNTMASISTCTIDDAFSQLLHPTDMIGHGFTVLTPDVSGNYTIDLTYFIN